MERKHEKRSLIKACGKILGVLSVCFLLSPMGKIPMTNSLLSDKDSSRSDSFTAGIWADSSESKQKTALKVKTKESVGSATVLAATNSGTEPATTNPAMSLDSAPVDNGSGTAVQEPAVNVGKDDDMTDSGETEEKSTTENKQELSGRTVDVSLKAMDNSAKENAGGNENDANSGDLKTEIVK